LRGAFELQFAKPRLGDQALYLRLLDSVIELQQQGVGLDRFAGLEVNLTNLAGDLRGNEHALGSDQCADRLQVRLPLGHCGGRDGHGCRWLRLGLHSTHLPRLAGFDGDHAAEQQAEKQNDYKQARTHETIQEACLEAF
jgi:hypothetical protein